MKGEVAALFMTFSQIFNSLKLRFLDPLASRIIRFVQYFHLRLIELRLFHGIIESDNIFKALNVNFMLGLNPFFGLVFKIFGNRSRGKSFEERRKLNYLILEFEDDIIPPATLDQGHRFHGLDEVVKI